MHGVGDLCGRSSRGGGGTSVGVGLTALLVFVSRGLDHEFMWLHDAGGLEGTDVRSGVLHSGDRDGSSIRPCHTAQWNASGRYNSVLVIHHGRLSLRLARKYAAQVAGG